MGLVWMLDNVENSADPLTEFFFQKFFFLNFFEEFSKFYVGMNCKDWKNDLGELNIGEKGFWANVLPTDRPTDRRTDTVTYRVAARD